MDNYSRKCLAIDVGQSLRGIDVVGVLERLRLQEGIVPKRIQTDNGSEFISKEVDRWAYENGVIMDYSRPGKPTDNPFIESFNGSFRDECLNAHWFLSLEDADEKMVSWRVEYNSYRPHSSLGGLTPDEFIEKHLADEKMAEANSLPAAPLSGRLTAAASNLSSAFSSAVNRPDRGFDNTNFNPETLL